jgi:hypothetical protein
MLGALQCLRVSKSLRDQIGNALADGRPKVCDRLLHNDDEDEVHSPKFVRLGFTICYHCIQRQISHSLTTQEAQPSSLR